ncbi:MAG: helix-turn-helix domain-containing protein [Terriglobales bacterium]
MPLRFVRFAEFELDFAGFELQRRGLVVRMESLPLRLLMLLIARKGELVTRREIEKSLWGDGVFVDVEQGINTAIRKIRLGLRDHPERPRFVQTVVGRGYRFLEHQVLEAETSASRAGDIKEGLPTVTMEELGQAVLAAAGLSASPPQIPHRTQDAKAEPEKDR